MYVKYTGEDKQPRSLIILLGIPWWCSLTVSVMTTDLGEVEAWVYLKTVDGLKLTRLVGLAEFKVIDKILE